MRHENNGEREREPAPHTYPITQDELGEYLRLEGEIQRLMSILAYRRGQIIAGMDVLDAVEPGWHTPRIVYRNTGTYTLDDDGDQVELVERRLVITSEDT